VFEREREREYIEFLWDPKYTAFMQPPPPKAPEGGYEAFFCSYSFHIFGFSAHVRRFFLVRKGLGTRNEPIGKHLLGNACLFLQSLILLASLTHLTDTLEGSP